MKKENRLKKRKQFNWTFRNGEKTHSKNLILVYVKTRGNNYKVGFSVTKKVGKAVTRNRVKRQLKEAVRKFENNISSNCTIIFIAKPEIIKAKFIEIVNEVEKLLKKSNLYKEIS